MSSLNESIGNEEIKYSENLELRPSGLDDLNAFEISDHLEETLDITIPVGGKFSYSYEVHVSVGKRWESEYDETAFEVQSSREYLNPRRNPRMSGGDRALKTETFTALRNGDFQVVFTHVFPRRGEYITIINVQVC